MARIVAVLLVAVLAFVAAHSRESPASPSRGEHRRVEHRSTLDPALATALRRARSAAASEGVEIVVNSGRRSPAHQARLLREAIAKYGSEAEARRWVATPQTSAHVSGDAVDIARAGAAWLAVRGAAYGLCPIYANEPWHYELRPRAASGGCPPEYPDPTYDPRMNP